MCFLFRAVSWCHFLLPLLCNKMRLIKAKWWWWWSAKCMCMLRASVHYLASTGCEESNLHNFVGNCACLLFPLVYPHILKLSTISFWPFSVRLISLWPTTLWPTTLWPFSLGPISLWPLKLRPLSFGTNICTKKMGLKEKILIGTKQPWWKDAGHR